jgi:hypothetical protein
VAFFPGGRVRVVSDIFGAGGNNGQILRKDPHAADTATKGVRVADLFSKAELAEMNKKWDAEKKKPGDWR